MIDDGASPLRGRTIALTRPRSRVEELSLAFAEAGAAVRHFPVFSLRLVAGEARALARARLRESVGAGEVWWAITSASVVSPLAAILAELPGSPDSWAGRVRWAVVGEATGRALHGSGLLPPEAPAPLVGTGAGAASLVGEIVRRVPGGVERSGLPGPSSSSGPRVVHITSDRGRPELAEGIQAAGGVAQTVVVVRHHPEPDLRPEELLAETVDALHFASPSAAEGLLAACPAERRGALVAIPAVAIGPTTGEALRRLGFRRIVEAEAPGAREQVAAAVALLPGP